MAIWQGLATIGHCGVYRAQRGWRTRPGMLAVILYLSLLVPGAWAVGSLEWAVAMGGTGNDQSGSIAVDDAGNVYTNGWFENTADFGPFQLSSAGGEDIYVAKLASDGRYLWVRSMGGAANDRAFGIAVDDAGNVYTTGSFRSTVDFDPGPDSFNLTSAGSSDIYVQKLDAEGNFVWARSIGSASTDEGRSIALDSNGNIFVSGLFSGTADFDPGPDVFNLTSAGNRDIFVTKLDSNGNFVWARAMGGSGTDVSYNLTLDSAGNIYTTGFFSGTADFDPGPGSFNLVSAGSSNIFISKLDTDGDFVWARSMGGSNGDQSLDIAVDSAGNVYATGYFWSTVDFDPGPDSFNLTAVGGSDVFVSKLDTNGDFVWARAMGGSGADIGWGIAVDNSGNVYTTGEFRFTTDFDPGPDSFHLTSAGGSDIFVSMLDTNGDFVWARAMGGTGNDLGWSIAVDGTGTIYVTGDYSATVDLDPGSDAFNLPWAGKWDVFVLKMLGSPSAMSITPATTGPTNINSIDFTVTFSESVVNFDSASDLLITHSGTAHTGATISGGPVVYIVTVEGISGDGSLTVAVDTASDVVDLEGNPLVSSVTSAAVVIDNTPPTITALTVSPSALAPGDVALIQFGVSEILLGDPVVQVAGTVASVAPLETTKSLAHSYHWSAPDGAPVGQFVGRTLLPGIGYVNPEPWPYGPRPIAITLTDLAGNTVTHTEPEGLVLVSGLPVAWPGLVALAMLSAAAFAFRRRRGSETANGNGI